MAEKRPKQSPKRAFSGNHQRSWLWGRHAVREMLIAGRWPVTEIYVDSQSRDSMDELLQKSLRQGVTVEVVSSARLEELSRSTEHQGILARMVPFPYQGVVDFEADLNKLVAGQASAIPLLVVCDRIQDAHNFGAILRCCDGAKVAAVIVGDQLQAEVTPHVARSSSGAVNHLPIVRTDSLVGMLGQLKRKGIQLIAADANGGMPLWQASLKTMSALVIGSEAFGIHPDLLAQCDQRVTIPMHGQVQSLNAAVACGILLYEVRRQQTVSGS